MEKDAAAGCDGRIRAYSISLAIALLVLMLASDLRGGLFLALSFLPAGALVYGILRESASILNAAACACVALGLVAVVQSVVQTGGSFTKAVLGSFVAPEIFLFFLSSRLLSALGDARFSAFYARPFKAPASHFSSLASATALAGFLMLAFYALFGSTLSRSGSSPIAIVRSSLAGSSWIHIMLVFLFFLSIALMIDATLRHRRDFAALDRLRQTLAVEMTSVSEVLLSEVARFGPSRAVYIIGRELGVDILPHYEEFFVGSRRFLRGLPALLPLLGFLGTVIGLSATMIELEKGLGGGLTTERVAGALSGLGLKFETTLLGLFGNFVALTLLDLLERSEADCAAACRVLASACKARRREASLKSASL